MSSTDYKRLIHSAKARATSGFLSLVQRAIQDADRSIANALASARSGSGQSALNAARHFLRQDGNVFLRHIDALFRGYLDRAMETMYVDLRQEMRKRSIDELTLIDHDIVDHQIEVGRLASRMRETNEETIGRLNVIVGHLHGDRDARERENPFRPYLLARALYEAIRETAPDEARGKVLFEHLANALVQYLPAYYESIREVFESSGLRGEFEAQRSRAAHNQRYFGAPPEPAASLEARVAPALQRMFDTLQSAPAAGADGAQADSVQDALRKMLATSRVAALPPRPGAAGSALLAQLSRQQRSSAEPQPEGAAMDAAPRLSALRDQLNLTGISVAERMTVDVVALLFEFILEDTQIPAQARRQLARLQIPMLKAALLDPALLHEEMHPVRQLLNRISSVAAGCDAATPAGQALVAEIDRIVHRVLLEFDTDTSVFTVGLREFEAYLANHLGKDDGQAAHAIEAIEAAEKFSVLLTTARNGLVDALLPLNVDKRISDVIIHVWPHVLTHAAARDAESQRAADDPQGLYARYHAVLPELVWSVQEKRDPQERTALLRLLPDLVRRLRAALQLIALPDEEAKQILDQLVVLHTSILRNVPDGSGKVLPSLDELRQQFARVAIRWTSASWALDAPPAPHDAVIEAMCARHGVAPTLRLGAGSGTGTAADRDFLMQAFLLGTRIELHAAGGRHVAAQLVWVSTHRSLYLFRQEQGGELVLYTCTALLDALHDKSLVPLEYAPVFERAVNALLSDAAKMPGART